MSVPLGICLTVFFYGYTVFRKKMIADVEGLSETPAGDLVSEPFYEWSQERKTKKQLEEEEKESAFCYFCHLL